MLTESLSWRNRPFVLEEPYVCLGGTTIYTGKQAIQSKKNPCTGIRQTPVQGESGRKYFRHK